MEEEQAAAGEDTIEAADDTSRAVAAAPATDWGAAYSSAVRLGAGFVGTVLDRAKSAASTSAEEDEAEAVEVPEEDVPGSIVFGFAADLPDRIGRMTSSVSASTGPIRSLASFGWRVTVASPIGRVVSKPVDAIRLRIDEEAERLAAIGRREVAEGKVLVERVVDDSIDGVLDNVSESEALNDLIRDQALGIGDAAIQEVRETGAAADSLTDSIVRRLLRREQRPLPPMPANGEQ